MTEDRNRLQFNPRILLHALGARKPGDVTYAMGMLVGT